MFDRSDKPNESTPLLTANTLIYKTIASHPPVPEVVVDSPPLSVEEKNHEEPKEVNLSNKPKSIWLRRAILPSMVESALSMSLSGILSFFFKPSPTWLSSPFTSSSLALVLNFLIRTTDTESDKYQTAVVLMALRGLLFSIIDGPKRNTLLHELGHLLAVRTLFDTTDIELSVNPESFFVYSGSTTYTYKGLTSFGEKLGEEKCSKLMSAAGTGIVMTENYLSLIVAQVLPDRLKEVKMYLRFSVLMSLIHSIGYAGSAYVGNTCEDQPYHDFCNIQDEISPIAAIVFMVGSLLMLQLALSGIPELARYLKKKPASSQVTIEELPDDDTEKLDRRLSR